MFPLQPGKTYIVGTMNVTPDSFYDGGQYFDVIDKAVQRARQMIEEGADIIDIGGESSRPGAIPVSEEEELRRVLPVIRAIVSEMNIPISVDTVKPGVAREALKCGAKIINDISGLTKPEMVAVVAEYRAPVVLMHMQGTPQTMQINPHYEDVIAEITAFFRERIAVATAAGITDIILDPGIGFGKLLENNLTILNRLQEFADLGYPILVGTSRKSFIGQINDLPVADRLEGTIASVVIAAMHGARFVRVHDVRACRRALQIVDAVKGRRN